MEAGSQQWSQSQPAALAEALSRLETRGELVTDDVLSAFCFLPRVARALELALDTLHVDTVPELELAREQSGREPSDGDERADDAASWQQRADEVSALMLREKRRELERLKDALLLEYFPRMKKVVSSCFGGSELSELRLQDSIASLEQRLAELRAERLVLMQEMHAVRDPQPEIQCAPMDAGDNPPATKLAKYPRH